MPALIAMLVTPPSVLPNWASKVAVCTRNSWTRSEGGTYVAMISLAFAVAVLGAPSISRSLRLPRVPS